MPNSTGVKTTCWNQEGSSLRLSLEHFQSSIDPSEPRSGLTDLKRKEFEIAGNLLGVSAGEGTSCEESFIRGSDVVVCCVSNKPQPFQWQVYWRAATPAREITQLDLIVSLQTPLLESFPSFATHTTLPTTEAWNATAAEPPQQLDLKGLSTEPPPRLHCVVLRDERWPWTYVEMTQPKDKAATMIASSVENGLTLQRTLGGNFLEKGVIRRMHMRGILLPRDGDLDTAAKLFDAFCEEQPPLTA